MAVDEYYHKGHGGKAEVVKAPVINPKKVEQMFSQYKDAGTKKMESEGIQKFFADLGVDPMDMVTLVISKHMNAETMGEYTFEEFDKGFKELGCQSISDLKNKLPQLYSELQDPAKFKELYKYTFDFTKDQGYKNL